MKKIILMAVFALLFTAGIYAQTLEVSGEMKTGLYWEKVETPDKVEEKARIHNNDDAGPNEGRFRMNLHMKKDIIGMKVRFEQTAWSMSQPNQWAFAFAYGNFIDEQLRIVAGKLGESPWAAGGPDIWQELDNQIGVRTEIKPKILPGLNIGFVLNTWNNANYYPEKNTLTDILMESVLGISYTNDYFHGRFCYRLDGESDVYNVNEGMEMMYRLEERALRKVVDGLSIWVNGWWRGIGTENEDDDLVTRIYTNWFYAQWAPRNFTAQLRVGYHIGVKYNELHTRVSFYYNILDWLSLGAAFNFRIDAGDVSIKDVPYRFWNVEPQIRATFAPNTYVAFVYSFENEPLDPVNNKQTQKINLRTVFTF
ncbi:hypothetical protein R84B8_00659 [Treponema sp. R8-4-B8]